MTAARLVTFSGSVSPSEPPVSDKPARERREATVNVGLKWLCPCSHAPPQTHDEAPFRADEGSMWPTSTNAQ